LIFLDTNVLSETMRPKPDGNVMLWLKQNEAQLTLSTVAIAEVAFGIERIRPAERSTRLAHTLKSWRDRLAGRIHDFDEASALIYGEICGTRSRAGDVMDTADGMIAAMTIRHKATLASRNTRHFAGLSLNLINPWD
jgi:predicted nucleic acid-binding protein